MICKSQYKPFLIDLSIFFPQPMIAEQDSCKYKRRRGKLLAVQVTENKKAAKKITFYCEACKTVRGIGAFFAKTEIT